MAVGENQPEMLADPLVVLYDHHRGTLLYVLPEATAKRPQLVVEFDFMRRGKKSLVVSGYRPNLADLITRKINGGQNGAADRRALWLRATKVLAA